MGHVKANRAPHLFSEACFVVVFPDFTLHLPLGWFFSVVQSFCSTVCGASGFFRSFPRGLAGSLRGHSVSERSGNAGDLRGVGIRWGLYGKVYFEDSVTEQTEREEWGEKTSKGVIDLKQQQAWVHIGVWRRSNTQSQGSRFSQVEPDSILYNFLRAGDYK